MFLEKYELPERNKHGKKVWQARLKCDNCGSVFDEKWSITLKKQKKRKDHLCRVCLSELMSKLSSERLKLIKAKQSPEERRLQASLAGKKSQSTGVPSKTWFSRERWNAMSPENQKNQVMKANAALIEKLKSMTVEELTNYYRKVMRGCMGFISKGQQELEDALEVFGFKGNQQIESMNVDLCNHERKIVVEFNGDAYHCNPKTWKKDQYSTLIKMTAGEKWQKDIARYAVLRKKGYRVIVIWESNWKASKENCINLIREIYETD